MNRFKQPRGSARAALARFVRRAEPGRVKAVSRLNCRGVHRPSEESVLAVTRRRAPRRDWFLDTSPLRESPAYRRFWASGVASGIGHQLTAVAIGIHVYEISGSTAAVGLVGALALAPMIVMGVIGGSIVDAFDRRRVL